MKTFFRGVVLVLLLLLAWSGWAQPGPGNPSSVPLKTDNNTFTGNNVFSGGWTAQSGTAGHSLSFTNDNTTNSVSEVLIGTTGTHVIRFSQNPGDAAYGQIRINTMHNGATPSPANTEWEISSPSHISFGVPNGHIQLGIGTGTQWAYWQDMVTINAATPYGFSGAQAWRASGLISGGQVDFMPGIVSRFTQTNATAPLYELDLVTDLGNNTGIGGNFSDTWSPATLTHGVQVYGGYKRGLRVNGGMVNERTPGTVSTSTLVLDFGKGFCVDNSISAAAISLSTSNLWPGTTNYEARIFYLRSAGGPFTVTYNSSWATNGAALPTTVNAATMLRLHLEAVGGTGETNVSVVSAQVLNDPTFSWDTDALSFLSRASITDSTMSNAVNYLASAAKTHGWWSKMDCIYPLVGGNATAHSKNLKGNTFNITWNGSLTHNSSGVAGDGATGYGDTGYTMSSSGQYAQNSASLFCYSETTSPTSGVLIGGMDFTIRAYIEMSSSSTAGMAGMNNANVGDIPLGISSDWRGPFLMTRTASNLEALYVRGLSGSSAVASSAAPTRKVYVLARNSDGSADRFWNGTLSGAAIGSGITSTVWSDVKADWDNYQAILSRKVP